MKLELTCTNINEEGVKVNTEIFDIGEIPFVKADKLCGHVVVDEIEMFKNSQYYINNGHGDEYIKALEQFENPDFIIAYVMQNIIVNLFINRNACVYAADEIRKLTEKYIKSQT